MQVGRVLRPSGRRSDDRSGVHQRLVEVRQPSCEQVAPGRAECLREMELHHTDTLPALAGTWTGVAVDERDVVALTGQQQCGGGTGRAGADDRDTASAGSP